MRKPFEIVDAALQATTKTIANVARCCTTHGPTSNHFKEECGVVNILAIKVNVGVDHKFVQQCTMESVTALDYDADEAGNAILDIEWRRLPSFLLLLEDYQDIEVVTID
jgi:hypothetical protein